MTDRERDIRLKPDATDAIVSMLHDATIHLLHADQAVRAGVVAHRLGALDPVMWILSFAGRGSTVWLVLGAIVAIRRRRRHVFTFVLLAVLLANALTEHVLKPLFQRDRPFLAMAGEVIGDRPGDASFPSGHSATSFAAAFALSRTAPPAAAVWWGLAIAIACSRVYLGVHYPLDVIGGAAVGLVCGLLAMRLIGRTT